MRRQRKTTVTAGHEIRHLNPAVQRLLRGSDFLLLVKAAPAAPLRPISDLQPKARTGRAASGRSLRAPGCKRWSRALGMPMNDKMPSPGRQVSGMVRAGQPRGSRRRGRGRVTVPSRRPPQGLPGRTAEASLAYSAGGSGRRLPPPCGLVGRCQVDGMAPQLPVIKGRHIGHPASGSATKNEGADHGRVGEVTAPHRY